MDLSLSDEQRMLIDSARAFLARSCPTTLVRELEGSPEGFSREHWRAISSLEWPGMQTLELALVCEELGRGPLPSPLIATTTAAVVVMHAGNETQRDRWLPSLADGSLVGCFAIVEPGHRHEWVPPTAELRRRGDGVTISGTKTLVPYTGVADLIVATARRDEGVSLIACDAHESKVSCR